MRFWHFWGNFHTSWTVFYMKPSDPSFLSKNTTYGGNYIEVHHFENRKCLKIAIFCLKSCVWVICVFLVLLLAWGCITPQINQKNLIIVIIFTRSTPLAPEVSKMAYFLEKLTFFVNFVSSEPLILYFSYWLNFSIVGIYFSSRSDLHPFLINEIWELRRFWRFGGNFRTSEMVFCMKSSDTSF